MVGSSAREPSSELDEEEPAPAPDQYKRQSSAFVRGLTVPLPCPPALEPSLDCDKRTKKLDVESLLAPAEEEADPDPAPYESQRSLPLSVPLLFVPLPCPPAFEPPLYREESTGLFGSEVLPVSE